MGRLEEAEGFGGDGFLSCFFSGGITALSSSCLRASVSFSVQSTDGIDTTQISGENRILFVDRREYLSSNEDFKPTKFALHDNYPNPFNPTTEIRFDLPVSSDVSLTIINMIGQKIKGP